MLLVSKGLNFGIEFKSGSVFRLSFQEEASVEDVRKVLELDRFEKYFRNLRFRNFCGGCN